MYHCMIPHCCNPSVLQHVACQCMGCVCRWAYEQVAEALCRLYKDPNGRVGQHLRHGSPRAGCPGALADALLALAQGLANAHADVRYAHL